RTLVKFVGVDDRSGAEALRGTVFVPPDDLRDLAPDEFWPHDVVGCSAVLSSGETLGTVTDLIAGPAQDLLVVETSDGERFIPLVSEIVTSVDIDARRVFIDPPDGLL
ncbi:MAG: ribosome maturation factor RimM, partial [Actinomycetota bacterium]|nr:ribosome maturation factor RimM [Actinomycetota bacterium]